MSGAFVDRYVYLFVFVLLAIGLFGVLAKGNLVKKTIGLTIFSTAIYLFFIQGSLQLEGTAPVIDERGSDPSLYVDPLPHLLILTAIVVGVGVVGVALTLMVRLYRSFGTLDESVIAERLAGGGAAAGGGPGTGADDGPGDGPGADPGGSPGDGSPGDGSDGTERPGPQTAPTVSVPEPLTPPTTTDDPGSQP